MILNVPTETMRFIRDGEGEGGFGRGSGGKGDYIYIATQQKPAVCLET